MTAKIKQHIPNFISGFDPVEAEFETLNDLLNLEFVKRWSDNNGEDFYRFSVDDHYNCVVLMAEMKEGKKWWVIGYIYGLKKDEIGLPQWVPNKGQKQ